MTTERRTIEAEARWLSPDELETWHALNLLVAKLPAALGDQLQHHSSLSFTEYYVLAGISDHPERKIRMSNLAALTNSELSRLSHLVNRLERRGLVRREPDPTNGRFTHAILTPEGLAHLKAAAPVHVTQVRNLIFDVLDTDQQHALRTAARRIIDQLGDTC